MKITKLTAREILNSRGLPTVEVDLKIGNCFTRASVPEGKSKGTYEMPTVPAKKAVQIINKKIFPLLKNKTFTQKELDTVLIGLDKTKIGANTTLAISLAHYKTKQKRSTHQPVLMANLINGGKHAGNKLKIQEHMIVTKKMKAITATYHTLKAMLEKKYGRQATNVGDEGGFAPPVKTTEQACEFLQKALEENGYHKQAKIALDVAASEYYKKEKYHLDKKYTKERLLEYYKSLEKKFHLYSIEDPFEQNDFASFTKLTKALKAKVVTDDLTVTNTLRLQKAIKQKAGNAIILKPNQVGTITETLQAAKIAQKAKWTTIVSHRSGETNDTSIVQLAQQTKSHLKLGAPARGERIAKYNALLRNFL